ncbi:MAG: murein biosynthesis integral membrane protein MurJ [Planctomycetes bacterium]|nr:murein biosynthesis integral membrane protein MurJ [Planctomycetota bacterium]
MTLLRAATSISALTLVSRILGLVRDATMAWLVGVNWVSGAFVLAWMIPNLFRRLFGEGALAAAFIPAFTQARARDGDDAARRLLAGVTGALTVTLVGLVVLVIVLSFTMPREIIGLQGATDVSAAEQGALIWELTRLLFPYVLPICLLATYAGALNALGVFAPTAAAPVLLNLFWIGGLLYAAQGDRTLPQIAHAVATSLLTGGFVQLSLALVPLWRRGMLPAPRWPRRGDGTREVFLKMAPAAIGLSIVQFNLLLDQALAEVLVGPGSDYHIYLANRLVLFPHALVAIPLATAVFPSLAKLVGDRVRLARVLGRSVRYTLFLSLPAAIGMALVAGPLIDLVFVGGRYMDDDAVTTGWTTIALVSGLPALGVGQLYARALFAIGDTKTPSRVAVAFVALNVVANLVLVLGLGLGVPGFTMATTACSIGNALVLRRAVRQRGFVDDHASHSIVRSLIACASMAAALAATNASLPVAESKFEIAAFGILVPVFVGIVSFLIVAALLRVPELEEFRAWLAARRHSTRTNSM